MFICSDIDTYAYIYIYIYRERERAKAVCWFGPASALARLATPAKGWMRKK